MALIISLCVAILIGVQVTSVIVESFVGLSTSIDLAKQL
ncbi:hypothetical protein CTDIVETGP_2302 [Clostridium tyrobutyricum DIVETGP]|uniref:Uncharacterized protein n=1 Tax=Clostridium tyrobutyricum DIVETGP TaxID=1408889 RepID=W6NJZ5_CLOTY|nr:hypothetical protein CTK_C05320 [Clostridium tyrobutyricum]CDL92232.1 hypothetical protein CTDIVETGP_2302 [Clostridium tyrobutyricum DIVETGP]